VEGQEDKEPVRMPIDKDGGVRDEAGYVCVYTHLH
jgi:hypothetical protein